MIDEKYPNINLSLLKFFHEMFHQIHIKLSLLKFFHENYQP